MAEYKTHQKEAVLRYLMKHKDTPLSMEDIADGVQKNEIGESPGKSTVYRLIGKLVEEGTVKRFVKENSRSFLYQLAGGEACHRHLHMKCTACGKLLHMNDTQSEELLKKVFGDAGFAIDREQTTLYGCCSECSKNGV